MPPAPTCSLTWPQQCIFPAMLLWRPTRAPRWVTVTKGMLQPETQFWYNIKSIFYKQLENFTVDQLVSLLRCDLPGNSSRSIMLWKMLLTKLSFILDPALDVLAALVSASLVWLTDTYELSQRWWRVWEPSDLARSQTPPWGRRRWRSWMWLERSGCPCWPTSSWWTAASSTRGSGGGCACSCRRRREGSWTAWAAGTSAVIPTNKCESLKINCLKAASDELPGLCFASSTALPPKLFLIRFNLEYASKFFPLVSFRDNFFCVFEIILLKWEDSYCSCVFRLQAFTQHYEKMSLKQQEMVLRGFILRFLSHSGTRLHPHHWEYVYSLLSSNPQREMEGVSPNPQLSSQERPASPTAVLIGWRRISVFSRGCCLSERCWNSTLSSGLWVPPTVNIRDLVHCLWTNPVLVKLTFWPFHCAAWGSATPDSETAGWAAGSDWTSSTRQGADHQHDLRPPDWVSQQDRHPRLLIQPHHIPQNGKNKKVIKRK